MGWVGSLCNFPFKNKSVFGAILQKAISVISNVITVAF